MVCRTGINVVLVDAVVARSSVVWILAQTYSYVLDAAVGNRFRLPER